MSTRLRNAFESPILAALIGAAIVAGSLTVDSYVRVGGSTGPALSSGAGAPASSATIGSLYIDTTNATLYQNTDGASAWAQVGLATATTADYFYGTGYIGDVTFRSDGTSPPESIVPTGCPGASCTYTLGRPLYARNVTIQASVRINNGGYPIFASGTVAGASATTSVVSRSGNAASGSNGGAALSAGMLPGGNAGCNGTSGAGGTCSSALTSAPIWCVTNTAANNGSPGNPGTAGTACRGGGGGGGTNNGGVASQVTIGSSNHDVFLPSVLAVGRVLTTGLWSNAGAGGAGGGGGVGSEGGGSGGGPGWVVVFARSCGTGAWLVEANGGNGGNAVAGAANAGGGGGAPGGTAIVYCGAGTAPTVHVYPGCGGAKNLSGGNGGHGGVGHKLTYTPSVGWVHDDDTPAEAGCS